MKAYINRVVHHGAWGGGNHWVRAAYEEIAKLGHEVCRPDDFKARPTVIFLAGLDSDGHGISIEQAIMYKMYVGNVKLILRVNENDARKGTSNVDPAWIHMSEHVDGTVFVSRWLRDYFIEKGWACKSNTVVYNGVDQQVFKPQAKTQGSVNIVAHHWSDNYLKGFDIYDKLDEFVGKDSRFSFTYVGRDRGTFKNAKVIKPLYGPALGDELGKHNVYVSASRFDPGPNHVLEALACGLPTYVHKDGGGCVEFAGVDHVYSDWNELQSILVKGEFSNNTAIELPTWHDCIKRYVDFAESL